MTLTKEDVSAVIEKLVDKSLTFGCRILNKENSDEVYFNDGVFIDFIERKSGDWKWALIYDGDLINEVCEEDLSTGGKILGHPILLGDVLERMRNDESGTVDGWNTQEAAWIKLCELWQPLGFTKSLQEIAEMIEWEDNIAKPSSATSLFLFLKDILTPPL